MGLMIDRAPEITLTKPVPAIYARFHDENAMMNSASLAAFKGPMPARFVEVAPTLCEALFDRLAAEHPSELFRLIEAGDLAAHDLTFAAEAVGHVSDKPKAVSLLLALLRHESALVREGAIYGLSHFVDDATVRTLLKQLADGDPSPGVRAAAADVLD